MMSRSDIPRNNWVDRFMPEFARPYIRLMRLDRPIGTWLLLLPCWWSLALGWKLEPEHLELFELGYLYILFSLGAVIMRGAGCTINDLWDRNMDKLVARTADRPIASGDISVKKAILFLFVLFVLAALILFQLNTSCWLLGFLVLILVFTYPLFKRVTYWPQLILGLTFNWGALMGWTAITGSISLSPSLLYLLGIFWTLGYDTIYAHQDREDDALIGVKSSALFLRDKTKLFLVAFYGITLSGLLAIGLLNNFGVFFYSLIVISGIQLVWQILTLDINSPINCLKKFKSNRLFGLIVTVAIYSG